MSSTTAPSSASDNRITSTSVCRGLRISGLDRESTLVLTNQIMKWVRCSGEEWTVNRLKSIKVAFLQTLAGKLDAKPEWVHMNRAGCPSHFTRVFKLRKPQKVLSALMCYTTFIAKKPTKAQIDKFVSSVTSEPKFIGRFIVERLSNPRKYKPLCSIPPFRVPKTMKRFRAHYAWYGWWRSDHHASRNIRVPLASGAYDPSTGEIYPVFKSHAMSVETQASLLGFHPAIRRWLNAQQNPTSLGDVFVLTEINRMVGPVPYHMRYEQVHGGFPVGTIGFIQEPGYKLRAVANPLPTIQLALSRLGTRLKEYLKTIEEDCTFDQNKGVRDVQNELRCGNELSSIDLSDATNLFPYSLTREVVSRIPYVLQEDVELWDEAVKGIWLMPDKSEIRWTTGQPLGVYPSFFAFALSHHALVKSITPRFYRILGDDIVIDRQSGDRLKDLYHTIGCKISEPKTITSSVMAEFAGKVITCDKVLIQPKFRSASDMNFINYVQNLGPRALGFLQPRQRKVIKPLIEMPRDLHPLACGFNPKGKTYEQRCLEAAPFLERLRRDDLEVMFTQLGADLASLSWAIKLRAVRPEIAQGMQYYISARKELLEEKPSEGDGSQDEHLPKVDPAASLRLKVPMDISHLTKDELLWFIKASEATSGRLPIYHWPTTADKQQELMFNLLERIHYISGITRIHQVEHERGLETRPAAIEPADPRGNTILLILERKLKRSLTPKVSSKPARDGRDRNLSR